MKTTKWINSAKRRRIQAKFRRNVCRVLGYPTDCCATTGELLASVRSMTEAA